MLSYTWESETEQTLRLRLSSEQSDAVVGSMVRLLALPSAQSMDTSRASFSGSLTRTFTTTISFKRKVLFPEVVPFSRVTSKPRSRGGRLNDWMNTHLDPFTVLLPSSTETVRV